MTKYILSAIICLAAALGLSAKGLTGARSVVVEHRDGTTLQVNIHSGLGITFADGNATIAGTNDQGEPITVVTPLDDVKRWTLADNLGPELSGIGSIAADAAARPVIDGMTIRGLEPGATVSVVATDGRTVATLRANGEGAAPLPFASLAKGVYVIATSASSLKVAIP